MERPALAKERETTHDRPARRRLDVEDSSGVGTLDLADQVNVLGRQKRRQRLEEPRRVVVACDDDDRPLAGVSQPHQTARTQRPSPRSAAPDDRRDRRSAGRGRPASVSAIADDLVDDFPVLVGPVIAADAFPDVPIGGVESSHRPENGSMSLVSTSSLRVAHGGNGNSTTSGTGKRRLADAPSCPA